MKTPAPNKGRGKTPPPPPTPTSEPLGPDDFATMTPRELIHDLFRLVRRGGNGEDKAGIYQRVEALHTLFSSTADPSLLTPIVKLTKDIKDASRTLGKAEARFLVDAYYAMQENRIRSAHQVRTLAQPKPTADAPEDEPEPEPHDVLKWLQSQEEHLEGQIRGALDVYSNADPAGIWARSQMGIGPVIAAGLLANIDITRAPTVGHIWRFAGLDPTTVWGKGTKRPWNASLKRLCFLIGESFVKVSNREGDVYGKLYKERKEWETERNARLVYAEQAKLALEQKKFDPATDAFAWYTKGMLPPARIHMRAKRRAVKLFLAHLHEVLYWCHYGMLPPHPWVFEHGGDGHVHRLEVPNIELVAGLEEAKRNASRRR